MSSARPVFVLASASPARRRTLQAGGIDPVIVVSGVDESAVEMTDPVELCGTLARLKAEAVAQGLGPGDTYVLGCDSMLEFDGQVHGKPTSAEEATARWQRMRGRAGILHTGHCLIALSTGARAEAVAATTVHFGDISDAEIAAYLATGEPLEVAGAFTIDGRGAWFVDRIEGDAGNVIGVSLPLLRRLLAQLGTGVEAFWRLD
jgi:septum formation protein